MHQVKNLQSEVGKAQNPLIMLLVPRVMIGDIASNIDINDFIVKPGSIDELYVRVQRLLKTFKDVDTNSTIRCGDLIIDTVGCEVRLGGRLIELTFKEYELLRILATNKGRVFSREALLNKVWKYDYMGGERTVDVHVRRLRSKIEDADHTFIETIRNIGYRFRKDS
ncbi:MAG: response regulator transcription factor [Dehalococcoidia bacterium]|nr:MAG: response regulator transcription factor [Dehalococcoidia bacterium]